MKVWAYTAAAFAVMTMAGGVLAAERTITTDVVVVGAGAGGLTAGVAATDAGLKTIVLEKNAVVGGGGNYMEGTFFVGSALQKADNIGVNPERQFKRVMDFHHWRINARALNSWLKQTAGVYDWLAGHGVHYEAVKTAFIDGNRTWHMYKGGHGTVLVQEFSTRIKAKGGEIMTSTPAQSLIIEDGVVKGVKAVAKNGDTLTIRAGNTIIATGGFSGNKYLRELHDPRVKNLGTDNLPNQTAGDVMMAAVRVGAYLVGMDFIQSTPGAPAGKKMKIILNTKVAESIYVDKRGNRIVNEGARRDVIRDAVLGTPERYAYTVCDNENFMSYNSAVHSSVEEGIRINEAWTAPTIRELAQKMGVDPEGLEKTIDRYNNVLVKNQKDPDFGKAPRNLTKRIEKGPFWACYTGMTVHHTMGGINCNTKAQVLDWQGNVVPRLYAAGEITGGIHGTNRVGGNALLDCMVYGQIAGINAGKERRA